MSNPNAYTLGRFSSQMLTYLGTQRTVKIVTDVLANTYKYSTGSTVFPNPGSLSQATAGEGVVGSYAPNVYNATKCYFLSRGASDVYADTMTGLTIDIAAILGISPANLLVKYEVSGATSLTPDAYGAFNILRSASHQVGTATSVNNKYSLQARAIRS